MTEVLFLPPLRAKRPARAPAGPFFDRRELATILDVYSRMVAVGEWRDYGLEGDADGIAFVVFRRAAEVPLYRIVKRARSRRGGTYQVTAPGVVLAGGDDLRGVLSVFDRKMLRVADRGEA
ncbi:MAG: DUF2794 domain-containing protein [Alphaproteobacteria bacterium]|nr:DUF2794 domain-containing protein [Alphaproteobacteria bacterium]